MMTLFNSFVGFVVWLCSRRVANAVILQYRRITRKQLSIISLLTFVVLSACYAFADDFGGDNNINEACSLGGAVLAAAGAVAAQGATRVVCNALGNITNCLSGCSSCPSSSNKRPRPSSTKKKVKKKKKKVKKKEPIRTRIFTSGKEWNAFYSNLIKEAKKIPPEHGKHVHLADILKDKKMETLIALIFKVISFGSNDSRRNEYDLDHIVGMFKAVGVNIYDFYGGVEKLEERFDKDDLGRFLKRMLMYTLRFKQTGCACCGKLIGDDTLYGALGFESNHWLDDKTSNGDSEGTKCFEVNVGCLGYALDVILLEFVKTRLECWLCHNK